MVQEKKNRREDFSKLSHKKCKDCGRPLKLNLVNKNPRADKCFNCFKLSKGQLKQDVYRVLPNGDKVFVKTIDRLKVQKENRRTHNWRGGRR